MLCLCWHFGFVERTMVLQLLCWLMERAVIICILLQPGVLLTLIFFVIEGRTSHCIDCQQISTGKNVKPALCGAVPCNLRMSRHVSNGQRTCASQARNASVYYCDVVVGAAVTATVCLWCSIVSYYIVCYYCRMRMRLDINMSNVGVEQ